MRLTGWWLKNGRLSLRRVPLGPTQVVDRGEDRGSKGPSLRREEDARLLQRRGGVDDGGLVEDVVRRLQDLEALLELLVCAPEVREARDQQDLPAEPLLYVPH